MLHEACDACDVRCSTKCDASQTRPETEREARCTNQPTSVMAMPTYQTPTLCMSARQQYCGAVSGTTCRPKLNEALGSVRGTMQSEHHNVNDVCWLSHAALDNHKLFREGITFVQYSQGSGHFVLPWVEGHKVSHVCLIKLRGILAL